MVHFFGHLAERTGTASHTLSWQGELSVAGVRSLLEAHHPSLVGQPFRIAVDEAIMPDDASIRSGPQIAVLPPYSGG